MTEYNPRTETPTDAAKQFVSTTIAYGNRHLYIAEGWEVLSTFKEGTALRCSIRRRIRIKEGDN